MASSASLQAQQQLQEAKQRVRDAFVVFEHREGSRMVDSRDIPAIVRSLGVNPSQAQLQGLQQAIAAAVTAGSGGPTAAAAAAAAAAAGSADQPVAAAAPAQPAGSASAGSGGSSSSLVAMEQCEGLIASWLLDSRGSLVRDDFHLLMRAFQALDPSKRGWLDAEQLKGLLTACGDDALSADEANAMIDAAADNQGRINYQEYAMRLAMDGRGA